MTTRGGGDSPACGALALRYIVLRVVRRYVIRRIIRTQQRPHTSDCVARHSIDDRWQPDDRGGTLARNSSALACSPGSTRPHHHRHDPRILVNHPNPSLTSGWRNFGCYGDGSLSLRLGELSGVGAFSRWSNLGYIARWSSLAMGCYGKGVSQPQLHSAMEFNTKGRARSTPNHPSW